MYQVLFFIITAQPTLVLHPSGGVYSPEIQRQFALSCQAGDGYPATNLTWLKKATDDDEFGKLKIVLVINLYILFFTCSICSQNYIN